MKVNLEEAENIPLLKLIDRIGLNFDPGVVGEFHALRKIRNRVTHIREDELLELPDVDRILENYKWAINTIDERSKFVKSA